MYNPAFPWVLTSLAPDDAFSIVPYEKGHAFLYYLETLVGGASIFDPYLRAHIQRFSGASLDSAQWKDFLLEHFESTEAGARLEEVDFDAWLNKPGMPPVPIEHDQSLMKASQELAHLYEVWSCEHYLICFRWKDGKWSKFTDTWDQLSAHQKSMDTGGQAIIYSV